MAGETDNGEDQASGSHEPRECMPCRGTGQVISNLGGTPGKITCPWCGGGGVRVPGTDAQAGWPLKDSATPAANPASGSAADPQPEQAADPQPPAAGDPPAEPSS